MGGGIVHSHFKQEVLKYVERQGIQVNLAHATLYALFAYMCAYLKVYHPVEFICSAFNANEGKSEDIETCHKESRRLNIEFLIPSWRNTSPLCKVINGKILYGISLIKFCNRQISDELNKLSTNQYNSFAELLKDIRELTSLNSRQIGILINLGYFSEFGNNKKLSLIYEKFEERYKVTHVEKTKVKRLAEILEYEASLPNESYKPQEQARLEKEFYGFISTTYPNINSSYCMILSVDTKYTPRVTFFQFNTGDEITVKIKKAIFLDEYGRNRCNIGDVINVKKHAYRTKRKLVNDKWTETNEQELYIDDFIVVRPNNEKEKV